MRTKALRGLKVKEVAKRLEEFAPHKLAPFEKDNGLLQGSPERHVYRIGVILDELGDFEALNYALIEERCDMIIYHHAEKSSGAYEKGVGAGPPENYTPVYKCHLPLDFTRNGIQHNMAKLLGLKAEPADVSYKGSKLLGGCYIVEGDFTLDELIKRIDRGLQPRRIDIDGANKEKFHRVVLASGAGFKKEFMDQLHPDCYISGRMGHHDVIAAKLREITLIDATEFATHYKPLEQTAAEIQKIMPEIEVKFIPVEHNLRVIAPEHPLIIKKPPPKKY